MLFTFEECELINSFLEDNNIITNKDILIKSINDAKSNTIESELKEIADHVINKLNSISECTFSDIILNHPINSFTLY